MKKIYGTVCTVIVTALVGFILWIKGFIDGYKSANSSDESLKESAATMVNAADGIKKTTADIVADIKGKKEEYKGYSTIRSVDDLEEDESDD